MELSDIRRSSSKQYVPGASFKRKKPNLKSINERPEGSDSSMVLSDIEDLVDDRDELGDEFKTLQHNSDLD